LGENPVSVSDITDIKRIDNTLEFTFRTDSLWIYDDSEKKIAADDIKFVYESGALKIRKTIKDVAASESQPISDSWIGNYEVSVTTEPTTNGMASISYFISIKKDEAYIKTVTYHEPILCNGKYLVKENEKRELVLTYLGDENYCVNDNKESFKIKKENLTYYILGIGGEETNNEWIELKQK
jgi:hypothetical protein